MIRAIKASLAFLKLAIADKILFGGNMITQLTTNAATFLNLPVPVKILQADNDAVQANAAAVATGDHLAAALLTKSVKVWESDFRATANYVSIIAGNDPSIVIMGGLKPTDAETTPSHVLPACTGFFAHPEISKGAITAGCDLEEGSTAFVYVATPPSATVSQAGDLITITVGTTNIYVVADTHRQMHATGLASQVPINVYMAAINRAGTSPLTGPQEVTPQ